MSWRDTEEGVEKEEIYETKPSHQGTFVISMNSNVIMETFLTEVSWLHLTTPACVRKKPYPARKNDDDLMITSLCASDEENN